MNMYVFVFGKKLRKKTYIKLANQIKYGQNLNDCLYNLENNAKQNNKHFLAKMYKKVLSRYNHGFKFGTALADYVNPEEILLLDSGQNANKMEESLHLSASVVEANIKISTAIIGALAYPAVLSLLALVFVIMIALVVVPQLAVVIDPESWTGAAYVLYQVSNFVASIYGIFFACFLFITGIFIPISLPRLNGKIRFYLDKIPPYSIYKLTVGSIWLFTIATLMSSGLSLSYILSEMLRNQATSPYLKEKINLVLREVNLGSNLGTTLNKISLDFPDKELIQDLLAYEKLSNFETKLYDIASDFLTEGTEKIQSQAKIINTLAIILIGVLVILLLLAINSIQQNLTNMGV